MPYDEKTLALWILPLVVMLCTGPLIYGLGYNPDWWPITGIIGVAFFHVGIIGLLWKVFSVTQLYESRMAIIVAIAIWTVASLLFWRPVANLLSGVETVEGTLEYQYTTTRYSRANKAVTIKEILHYDIITESERIRISEPTSRLENLLSGKSNCADKLQISFLRHRALRNIQSVKCSTQQE
jgi:hypothetical protein